MGNVSQETNTDNFMIGVGEGPRAHQEGTSPSKARMGGFLEEFQEKILKLRENYLGKQTVRNSKDSKKVQNQLACSKRWRRLCFKISKFSVA